MYEHICLENIKKLCKNAGKYDNQQQYMDFIEEEMVSNPQGFTDNSKMSPGPLATFKNPSARK